MPMATSVSGGELPALVPPSVSNLKTQWPEILKQLPVNTEESGTWFLDGAQTISTSTLLIAFEDGLSVQAAIIKYDGTNYKVEEIFHRQLPFTAAELGNIQKQYGDPGYASTNFEASEGDGHLVATSMNMFLDAFPGRITVKIAWLDPDYTLPDQTAPGDIHGCDKVILLPTSIPFTTAPLTAALKALLADKEIWSDHQVASGKLYNYLGQGNLQLQSATVVSGTAQIYLTGTPPPLGGICDDPRLFVQIAETARQFPTVQKVQVFVNGVENTGSVNEKD